MASHEPSVATPSLPRTTTNESPLTSSLPEDAWLPKLDALHGKVLESYVKRNPTSKAQFEDAVKYLPGGNTRSVLQYGPFPLAMASGHDCHVVSVDGTEYLDLVSEFSAAFFGHSHPGILEAIGKAVNKGLNLGASNPDEVELAKYLVSRFASIEKVRFTNSGTEANIMAIGLGLAHTGRKKFLAFQNGYHGAFTHFGSASKGLNLPYDFIVAQYNVTTPNDHLLSEEIGAIIVEPMQGAGGMIPATTEFLRWARNAADRIGAVLIYDEIITSRLHYGGLQEYHSVFPDLTTLGKYLGGGFGFGACGGREDIMAHLNPGGYFHSGTYNNNTFSMAAGVAASKILTPEKIQAANALGDKLRDGINLISGRQRLQLLTASGFGSCVGVHFHGPAETILKDAFFFYLLDNGVYIGKRGFLSINITHDEGHIDRVLAVIEAFHKELLE
ncbi:hypothetical protein N0V84_008687 [Fusarium piperis]|uniref:Aminotransferase class-III n=1 Tax=Fusarium piperis TaxID=1435070 RepID=A0A9W8W7M4_9HYPO|nr:hypothetical protein N0V84_008687 [Fusarium piperis]